MNPTVPAAAPTPRPAHAFTGPVTRSQRARLVPQFEFDIRQAHNDSSTIRFYDKVSVVAFHWDNDDLNVVPLETELLGVFRDQYGFQTESFTIPTTLNPSPRLALLNHLHNHANGFAGDNTLRIYIYSGHSRDPGMRGLQWHLW
jgi:hypothetical protein